VITDRVAAGGGRAGEKVHRNRLAIAGANDVWFSGKCHGRWARYCCVLFFLGLRRACCYDEDDSRQKENATRAVASFHPLSLDIGQPAGRTSSEDYILSVHTHEQMKGGIMAVFHSKYRKFISFDLTFFYSIEPAFLLESQ
jgi:hypothetical protein